MMEKTPPPMERTELAPVKTFEKGLIVMPHHGYYGHSLRLVQKALIGVGESVTTDALVSTGNIRMFGPDEKRALRTVYTIDRSWKTWIPQVMRLRKERYDVVVVTGTPIMVQRIFFEVIALVTGARRKMYLNLENGHYRVEALGWRSFLRRCLRPSYVKIMLGRLGNLISRRWTLPWTAALPSRYLIEITNLCNLSCPLCPTGQKMITYGQGMMAFDNFKKLVDECAPYMEHIDLYNFGEPLLHPHFARFVGYAKEKGVGTVQVSSNGNIDLTPEKALRLIESGLDNLIVACDGTDQESYEKYRVGGKLEKLTLFVKTLAQAKTEAGSVTPQITMRFIPMKHNEHQVEEMEKLAMSWGVDKFIPYALSLYYGRDKGSFDKFHPDNPKYATFKMVEENGKLIAKALSVQKCRMAWETLSVTWDGRAIPCCSDFDATVNFGNVFTSGARAVWNGIKTRQFRRQFIKDKNRIPLCRDCDNIA